MQRNAFGLLIALSILVIGGFIIVWFGYRPASSPTVVVSRVNTNTANTNPVNTNSPVNENVNARNTNTDTVPSDDGYPMGAAQQYSTNADLSSSYYFGVSNLDKPISTPFTLSEYNAAVTTYGILFWKKGDQRTTTFKSFGDEKIPYENGVAPDFRWYDFKRKEFVVGPVAAWKTGDQKFDRVFAVHASSTQPRVVIEVGEYDIASNAFEPGLIDSQPIQTRGLFYNPVTNAFLTNDPLGVYKRGVGLKTTQWHGFMWDSQADMAAAVPGGEGCGPAPSMTVVNLRTGKATIINDLRQTIGWGGYDFTEDQCNPRNGRSQDGKWLVLMGKTKDSRLGFRLYRLATGGKEVKVVYTAFTESYDSVKKWDLSRTYPVITTEKGAVADFNK